MLQNREISIDQFIKFTSGGIKIADFNQIQTTLIKTYKEIYGSDIDLANTTADGIFINNLALIINNILQSFSALYSNLNVETASGVYLDNLCRLSNVSRKMATKSTVQLLITSTETTTLEYGTIFVDNAGIEWEYKGLSQEIQANSEAVTIVVTCKEYGSIIAMANSITQTLEVSPFIITQPEDASVGRENETDAELRARRDQSNGAQGITVEESLLGALLEIAGVMDAQIIVNNTGSVINGSSGPIFDGTSVNAHDVYIIIRKAENVAINDTRIGQTIAERMTPGISTTQTLDSTTGISKQYTKQLNQYITWLGQQVFWKEAIPIHPTCSITITKGLNYTTNTTENIAKDIITYLNKLHISQLPTKNEMIITATYADSSSQYIISDVDLSQIGINTNTYYNYTHYESSVNGQNIVITFN